MIPSSFSIDHTPARSAFSTTSAPRRVRVFLLPLNAPNASAEVLAADFEYRLEGGARHVQTFEARKGLEVVARAVRVEVLSNHGNPDFTCLYRVRVHQ